MVRQAFFLFFLLVLFGVPCQADPSGVGWWRDPEVVGALSLTPGQSRRIEELVRQSLKRRKERLGQIREVRREVFRLLGEPELREEKLWSLLKTLGELDQEQREDVVRMRLKVRRVLSKRQFEKLLELNPRIMRQRWFSRKVRVRGKSR